MPPSAQNNTGIENALYSIAQAVTAASTKTGYLNYKAYLTAITTTASASWQTLAPTGGASGSQSITLSGGGRLLVLLTAPVWMSGGNGEIGVNINSTDYELGTYSGATGDTRSWSRVIVGLPAGTYTLAMRFKSSGGSNNNVNPFNDIVLTALEY